MSEGARRYWVEAGTILYFEKQPDKSFIPRRGESVPSIQVVKADDYATLATALREAEEKVKQMSYLLAIILEGVDPSTDEPAWVRSAKEIVYGPNRP